MESRNKQLALLRGRQSADVCHVRRAERDLGPEVASAVRSASNRAFHVGIGISTTLVALGGLLGLAGIRNPRRAVRCQDCPGGQLAGQPLEAARDRPSLQATETSAAPTV
jgi:hypothetical protein